MCDSSSTDSENSQDDSEYNFIPGIYVVEDERNEQRESVAAVADFNNEAEIYAYDQEPLADAKWLEQYDKEVTEREEKEEELVRRLAGVEPVENWCKCGNCSIRHLQNSCESFCCHEIEECLASLSDEMVLNDIPEPPNCVTLHPGFRPVCLEKWSLRNSATKYKRIDRTRYKQTASEARFLRSVAYREFTFLIHGYLGSKRIPLPSCVYHAIREQFNEEGEEFAGYEDNNESYQ